MASAPTQASDQSSNLAAQDKSKMEEVIQLEVAKRITGVPWRSTYDVKAALTDHWKAVETVIKLSVPLDHPNFGMQALNILLDLDPDIQLSTDDTGKKDPNFPFGRSIGRLTSELDRMMDGFVRGNHGQLTGWKADIEKVMESQFQRTGKKLATGEVKKRFLGQQRECISIWIHNHNKAYLQKLWVSLQPSISIFTLPICYIPSYRQNGCQK